MDSKECNITVDDDQINSQQTSTSTPISTPLQRPGVDEDVANVVDTEYVHDQNVPLTGAGMLGDASDSPSDKMYEECVSVTGHFEDISVSQSSVSIPWNIQDSSPELAIYEELVTETDDVGEKSPLCTSASLVWTFQEPSIEPDMSEIDNVIEVENHSRYGSKGLHFQDEESGTSSNSDGTARQSKQYKIEELLATAFPHSPQSHYRKEPGRKEQVSNLKDTEKLDDDIYSNFNELADEEDNNLSSLDQSTNQSASSNAEQSWSEGRNESPDVKSNSTERSVESDTPMRTSNNLGGPHTAHSAERNNPTKQLCSNATIDFVAMPRDIETDTNEFFSQIPDSRFEGTSNATTVPNDYEMVTVKFLMNNGEVYTQAYQLYVSAYEMKSNLSNIFKIPIEYIALMKDGEKLEDGLPLAGLGIEPCGTIELKMHSEDPCLHPIMSTRSLDNVPIEVPDVINVTIRLDRRILKEVIVEIWNQAIVKPWIGGYRDKKTLLEYHHAFSQTSPRKTTTENKIQRVTQTTTLRNKNQSTKVDQSTQVYHTKAYIPCIGDKIMVAKKYTTFAESNVQQQYELRQVVTIQRYVRGWMTRKMIRIMREEYRKHIAREKEIRLKAMEYKASHARMELPRTEYPRTRADFETMYNCVERWRLAEVNRITGEKTEAPRKAELCSLLEKEIVLLNSIEKHRIKLREERNAKKELDFMKKSGQPITWTNPRGQLISMDTIRTQRARELGRLYLSLCHEDSTTEERVNLLVSLKHALKSYNTRADPTINEMMRLMVRECDCLVRGLKRNEVDMLRNRLRKLFLEFMRDPGNDPESSSYSARRGTIPADTPNMVKCNRCAQFKAEGCFPKAARVQLMRYCAACTWLDNSARSRADLGPCRGIVRAVRDAVGRAQQHCATSVAFAMQDEDFYFLINYIWHACSALSESRELDKLVLARWDVARAWSPWNCILLNEEEAEAHLLLEDIHSVYEASFISQVQVKHHLARSHFRHLVALDTDVSESGSSTRETP